MSVATPPHIPVLFNQVFELLEPEPGDFVVDCTLGMSGHARELVERIGPTGRLLGFDLDPQHIAEARVTLGGMPLDSLELRQESFSALGGLVESGKVPPVDRLLADLGFASSQMDDHERGLSFSHDGPLDMRLGPDVGPSAADLVNTLDEQELAGLIHRFGEERRARPIARAIIHARSQQPIQTTGQLADLVRQVFGLRPGQPMFTRRGRIDPATRTFMALRIAVNQELEHLDRLLRDMPAIMAPGGRVAIISFHSLEDRPVKQAMRSWSDQGWGRRITRKPVVADERERCENPRSRSAKLRVFAFESAREARCPDRNTMERFGARGGDWIGERPEDPAADPYRPQRKRRR
ncbi:MAG: 16S rRNA (cytosine(1402)-N(4))-methyltransferase RsmH [Phycisphaeraceae bacterium]|nr:16S rRNA (cytosine(1402)-N(4))-methyltransferase RsmH [Phycisphaeraceae bacterium]